MEKAFFDSPIFSISPYEAMEMRHKAQQTPVIDPDIQEIVDGYGGRFILGNRNTDTGRIGWYLGEVLATPFADEEDAPLNLTKTKSEFSPVNDDLTFGLDNNIDGIIDNISDVPFEHWDYLFSAGTYGQFKDRVRFVKAGLPQAQALGTGGIVGTLGDIGGMMAIGMAAEPLVMAGLGTTTTLAGRAAASSSGMFWTQAPAQAAMEAAATLSRSSLTARYAALGVAEEVVYQSVRNGIDPVYSPDASQVIYDIAYSAGVSGLLGGAIFGRTFAKDQIQEAAKKLRAEKTVDLPGGWTVTYDSRLAFDSPAAADRMLFAAGTGNVQEEADKIAKSLWADWERSPRIADLSLPKEAAGGLVGMRSAIKAAAFELSVAGLKLDEAVFAKIGQALVKVERQKLVAGAFNKAFWEEVSKDLPADIVANLRKPNERTLIPGIDRSVMDLSQREDMVDAVWDSFKTNKHMSGGKLSADGKSSLIFQVLQQLRQRGATVNREVVADVVDELRRISQNPPTRVNAKGRKVLDTNARRLAVAQVINKRVKDGKEIYLPPSLVNKMNVVPATRAGVAAVGSVPSGLPGSSDFSDVPRLQKFLTERLPIWEKWGNQSARLMQSENGAARLIGFLSFNARRAINNAQPQTIFEAGSSVLHHMQFAFMRGYRNQFIRFALGNGSNNISMDKVTLSTAMKKAFGSKELRRDFNRRVAQQLRTGAYDDAVDAVNDAAKGFREIFNKMHSMAAEVGLRGFDKTAVVNYMPRLWRWDKIRRLATTPEGKKDLTRLIKAAIDQNGRKVVIDGVEQTIKGDIDAAAKAFTERLISIAKKTENAPMTEQDQELVEALGDLLGPVKATTPSKTPFGRARILLNEQATVQTANGADHLGDGKTVLSIADLTNDDLPFVFKKYVTSMMGAINEKRLINAFNDELRIRGVFSPEYTTSDGTVLKNTVEVTTIDEMIGLARKIGGEIDTGHEEGLREVIAAMRYEPLHHGTTGVLDRVLGIAIPYGYLTTGGQFGLAAMGEMARIVGTLGFTQMMRQMPILTEMIGNWKNMDKDAQNFASFIDTWFAPSTDRMRRAFMETGQPDASAGILKRGLDSTANLMSDITLLAPITSFTQQLTAATTIQHLYEASKGVTSRMDNATLRTLGLEPEQYQKIIDFVGTNAEVRNGFLGERITNLKNLDAKEMDLVKAFVQRTVDTRIQSIPTRGDFHKLAFGFMGRLLTQFRTFNLKGIDNFLIQNAGRTSKGAGIQVAKEIGATMLFSGLIAYARNYADWRSQVAAGDRERADETEKLLTVDGALRGAAMGPAEFFLPTTAADSLWTTLADKDPLFSPYRYSGLAWYGFPGQAAVSRSWAVGKDLYGASVGDAFDLSIERDITRGTLHKARLLLPGQNMPILKQYFNILESDIATEYNLQKTQPRRD
ncbi:hypothetical protein UFOVP401_26 [uncultured Caudovirales phage]|uniref:Large polyvalent protein associated domain-containing protein n=1 Tax=uncultured Caudovirales phage TaxID=2100421 RepID=A0A6J5M411_9CAUD|nr:hypothetical protein UFOVP401_26 [uncultured Caudovirales phage]